MKRLIPLLLLAGCGEPYVETGTMAPITTAQREYLLVLAVDVSGSFMEEMFGNDGRAYRFTLLAADKLFRDRMGEEDHILLSQLSANDRPLLWEGTPRELRRKFGSSDALKHFILSKADPQGSRLFAGVAETLDYVSVLPGVPEGQSQVCVLVLSDMLDNSPTQAEDWQKMTEAMKTAKEQGIHVGFYFVDINMLPTVRDGMSTAGLDTRYIESGILESPPLPVF